MSKIIASLRRGTCTVFKMVHVSEEDSSTGLEHDEGSLWQAVAKDDLGRPPDIFGRVLEAIESIKHNPGTARPQIPYDLNS